MGATKGYNGVGCDEREPKDNEEDFLSLSPSVEAGSGERHDASDSEDFISLALIDDSDEKSRGEPTDNDLINKNIRKKSFNRLTSLPPWMEDYVDYRRINPLVALHNEIVSFQKLMEPRENEMKTREELVAKFTALAESTFNECKVEVFGSQATGYVEQSSGFESSVLLEL